MSYIHQREKVFNKRGGLSLISSIKFKTSGRLKYLNHNTDPRSWSLDRNSQRKYFLDSVTKNVSSSSSSSSSLFMVPTHRKNGKTPPVTTIAKRKLFVKKARSAEQLTCRRSQPDNSDVKLTEANFKIRQLESQKDELEKASQEYQLEIDNLRNLVNGVQEELCFLHHLKEENINLKAELKSDIYEKVINAEEEINHLNSQFEIYKGYKSKYEDLRSSNEQLKDEYDQISLSLKEMEWNNTQLQNEIESLKIKVDSLESRELAVSNATVDKEVLRERLQMREEKIACLVTFLEEKEMAIQELMLQLQRMTSSIVAKDTATGKHLNLLKLTLNEKVTKIEELEDKLHESELLIRELENVRDHFRLSNCALTENMKNYKKQFNIVVSCSKKLLSQLEIYKLDIDDKDLLIRKLSIFPQSATSIVQFAQLLNILRSTEEMIDKDQQGAVSFIPTMRRIVEQLKGEIIGDRIQYPLYEIYDSDAQTEFTGIDKCIQNELFYIEHKSVEVSLPDRYYFAYERSKTEIAQLNSIIEALKESFLRVDSANHSLEKKIISSMAENSAKEKEICSLHDQLVAGNEEITFLRNEINSSYSLLNKSLCELDVEKGVRESTAQIFEATLESTTYEYNRYVNVLEAFLKHKEEKIKFLEDYLCNEPQKDETLENEHFIILENELKQLSENYLKEKQTVKTLNTQVVKLQGALAEKMDHFKIVQEKLLRAEKIFEHLNNIENQCLLKGEHSEELAIIPTEQIVVKASNKILSHSERLESHLKEEKNLKEKLLRETVSREYVSNLMQRNTFQKRNLKKNICQLKNNIFRIQLALSRLKNKLKLSKRLNNKYNAELSKLKSYNAEIKNEVEYIKDQLQTEKSKNNNLEMSLEMKNKEQYDLRQSYKKVECILVRIIKQFEKRGKYNSVTTQTNLQLKDKEKEISDLKNKIKELKTENTLLSDLSESLKERLANILYIPQKESPQTSSTESQTESTHDEDTLNNMRNHYENVIQILYKDKALEMEESEKLFKNILQKITEAYDKDLANVQSLHDMELEKIQKSHQEKCKDHINKHELEEAQRQELEKQKSHYEGLLKSKKTEEDELIEEIKELKEEVGKIIAQKQKDDSTFNEKIKIQLTNVKTRFKKQYKRLKKSHEAEILEMNKKYEGIKKINELNIEHREEYQKATRNDPTLSIGCQTVIANCEKLNVECQTIAFDETKLNQVFIEQFDNPEYKEYQGNKESIDYSINTMHNKKIGINVKERIKCSIKEANGLIPKEIFTILNALRPSTKIFNSALNLCLKDKSELPDKKQMVSDICGSFIDGADAMEMDCQEMLKNLSMYERRATQEKTLIQEIRDVANKRSNIYCPLEQSFNLEFDSTEKFKAQLRDEWSDEVYKLKKKIANLESNLRFERSKNENLNNLVNSMKIQRRTSEKLEMSLERLRTKLERAELCEKRLSKELEEDKKTSERIQVVIESNKIEPKQKLMNTQEAIRIVDSSSNSDETDTCKCSEVTRDVEENKPAAEIVDEEQSDNNNNILKVDSSNKNDLKVIFIQRCGILNTWKEEFNPQMM